MSLPENRIKKIKLPNNTIYTVVPEMLQNNGYSAELPELSNNDQIITVNTDQFIPGNKTFGREVTIENYPLTVLADDFDTYTGEDWDTKYYADKIEIQNINSSEVYTIKYPSKSGTFALLEDIPEVDFLKKVTYSELKRLRDTSQLTPGMQYRIIDYDCTTTQADTKSALHRFDIIVTADSENTLNENARACVNDEDTSYFREKELHADWMSPDLTPKDVTFYYNLQSDDSIQYDENGIHSSAKVITELTTFNGLPAMVNPNPEGGSPCYYIYDGTFSIFPENTLVSTQYSLYNGEVNYPKNGYKPDDIYVDISYVNINGVDTPVMYKTDVNLFPNKVDYDDSFVYAGDFEVDGVNYNRWKKYESNSVFTSDTYSGYDVLTQVVVVNNRFIFTKEEFHNALRTETYDKWNEYYPDSIGARDYWHLTNHLVDEKSQFKDLNLNAWKLKYCLDNDINRFAWALDGQAIVNIKNESLYFDGEQKIRQPSFDNRNLDSTSEYQFAWGTEADVADGDPANFLYSKTEKLQDNDIVYELGADTFTEVTVVSGKGVIYWMKDDWNNEAPYDFKNIQFKRYKITRCQKSPSLVGEYLGIENVRSYTINTGDFIWCYTFTWINRNNVVEDCSIVGQTLTNDEGQYSGVCNNKLAECSAYLAVYPEAPESFGIALNNIVIQYSYEYHGGFFSGIHDNTFKDNCYNNTLGSACYNNTFAASCCYNIFGGSCECNTFGNGCNYNIFGNGCYNNTFGDNCNGNIFDTNGYGNTFDTNCSNNTLGDSCEYNILDAHCFSNTFGPSCFCNTLDNTCSYIKLGTRCSYNTFGNGCSYIVFGGSSNYPSDYYQYNIIDNGCSYLCLYSNATGSYNYQLQNVHIHSGIAGTYNNYKLIKVDINLSYTTDVYPSGSTEMFI